MKVISLFVCVFLLSFADGCRQLAATPIPASTNIPTVVPSETFTPAPTLTATATATPNPTVTSTHIPSPTITASVTTTEVVGTPTATPDLSGMPDLSKMTVYQQATQSPDGKWILTITNAIPLSTEGEVTGDSAYDQVKLTNVNKKTKWIVIDQWANYGLGSGGYQPFLWSSNGRYLYLTYRPSPDGCGVFVNASNLLKIDLNSGGMTEVVPDVGLWLSLSPDETQLAYIGYGDRGLVLRDLTTGVEREVKLNPGNPAGQIVWSPDGTALVLTLAINPCTVNWAESTSILRVEIGTLEQTTLIQEDEHLFITVEWPTSDRVLLKDGNDNFWWMDAITGEVTMK